jgi:uncharacterized protein (DUF433 family)
MNKSSVLEPEIKPEMAPLRFDASAGVIRVGETRVTLDSLVASFLQGATPDEIARNYDSLTLSEVYRAIGYYLAHQEQVDAYLNARRLERAQVQSEVETAFNPVGIRARLLARQKT